MPDIWLPKGELKATVADGSVRVWDEMIFKPKAIAPPAGFQPKPEPEED